MPLSLTPTTATSGPLDTSLKRHTAFIKRLRTALHSPESVPVLVKEATALSLEKYLEEIDDAAAEGVTRCKNATEVFGAVEVSWAVLVERMRIGWLDRRLALLILAGTSSHF